MQLWRNRNTIQALSRGTEEENKYRVYTKEWCGFPLFTIETAPFFCVYSIHKDTWCPGQDSNQTSPE
jgi:hypothetical protein